MILEVADLRVPPERQSEFDTAIRQAAESVVAHAEGFRGYQVQRCIETPGRYLLMIWWDTLENHTIDFRQGPLFPQWRAIVGPFFTEAPVVEHFEKMAGTA
jgi:heme-degrading monooxygenase HmoA